MSPLENRSGIFLSGQGQEPYLPALFLWVMMGVTMGVGQAQFGPQCEEITIPMCRNMPYNLTRLPNLLHHSTQENAQLAIDQFELLRWTKCSDQLEFFLCSMYAPICAVEFVSEAIPPCRSVCEDARQGCEPLLSRFDIPWPDTLDCSSLPLYDRGVCINPDAIISTETAPEPEEEEAECRCRRTPKLREKPYKARHFDYVFRGKVKSIETFGGLTLTAVTVTDVVRVGRVLLRAGMDAHLWTNRSCACPPLTTQGDYLLMGWEDFANSRLLYLEGSIAVPYRRRYVRKIQQWDGFIQTSQPVNPDDTISKPFVSTPSPYPPTIEVANSRKNRKRKGKRRRRKKDRQRIRNGESKNGRRERRKRKKTTENHQV